MGGAGALNDGCPNSGTTYKGWALPPGNEPNGPLYAVYHGKASCAEISKRFAFLVGKPVQGWISPQVDVPHCLLRMHGRRRGPQTHWVWWGIENVLGFFLPARASGGINAVSSMSIVEA